MKKKEELRLEILGLEHMKSVNGLSNLGIEFLNKKKQELKELKNKRR